MKKIVCFVLVMLMAGVVNAGAADLYLDITVGGDHAEIIFIQESANPHGSGGELEISFYGYEDNIVVDVENLSPTPNYAMGQFDGFGWGFEGTVGLANGKILIQKIATAGVGTPGKDTDMNVVFPGVQPYVGTFGFSFEFIYPVFLRFEGIWDGVDISVLNSPFYFPEPPASAHFMPAVPEPMTMSLLGVGGLLAARRWRKL